MKQDQSSIIRWIVASGSVAGLLFLFLFQRLDIAGMLGTSAQGIDRFLINRTFRFLMNDALAIGLIYGLFGQRKYVFFALVVQLLGVILILIPYFILKLRYPGYNGPMLSFLHRLVLNPTLLLLLVPAFYYQHSLKNRPPE